MKILPTIALSSCFIYRGEPTKTGRCQDEELSYDSLDNDCDERTPDDDIDGDGWLLADDCDDNDAMIGGPEVPYDGIDNDCNPSTLDNDIDNDGFLLADDCNDADPVLGGPEVASDGIDNDCDTATDCDDTGLVHGEWVGDLTTADVPLFCDGYDCRSLTIEESTLTDLTDLACLTSVRGNLDIYNNAALLTLSGLDNLTNVEGYLYIWDNDLLLTLSGLDSLASVGGNLDIWSNTTLTDVTALYGLTNVASGVTITDNIVLTDTAAQALVDAIDDIGGMVTISGNN